MPPLSSSTLLCWRAQHHCADARRRLVQRGEQSAGGYRRRTLLAASAQSKSGGDRRWPRCLSHWGRSTRRGEGRLMRCATASFRDRIQTAFKHLVQLNSTASQRLTEAPALWWSHRLRCSLALVCAGLQRLRGDSATLIAAEHLPTTNPHRGFDDKSSGFPRANLEPAVGLQPTAC